MSSSRNEGRTYLWVNVSNTLALLGVEALVHVWVAEVLLTNEGGVIGGLLVGLGGLLLNLLEEVLLLEAHGTWHPLLLVHDDDVVFAGTES